MPNPHPAGAAPQVPELDDEEQTHFDAGLHAFNTGDFYDAHDHFEALWGEDFWKGLVQASVALHHHRIGNAKGLEGLPENVVRILDAYRPNHMGLDIDRFLDDFRTYVDAVAPGQDPGPHAPPRLHAVDNP